MLDLDKIIRDVRKCKIVPENDIQELCFLAQELLIQESNIQLVDPPVTICGDIHGQLHDLLRLFKISKEPPHTKYLFLGDFVDRGFYSLETFLLLLCYKVRYPDRIYLIRGNHESRQITSVYGFYDECMRKYGSANPGDRDDRRDPADRPQTGGPARRAHVRPAVVRPRGKHPGLGGVAARRGLPVRLHRDRAVSVQKQPQSDCPRPPAGHGGLQGGVRRRPRDRLVGAQLLLPVRQRGCRADARRQPQPQLHRLRQHAAGLLRDPVQKTRRRLLSVSVPVANGWPASRRACTTINFIVWQISGTTTSFLLLHDGHEKHVDAGRAHIHRGERRCLRRVCGAFPAAPSPVQAHLPAQVQLRHRARQREAGPAAAGPADLDLCPAQEAALLRHPAGRHRRVSVSAVPVYRGLPCSRRHSHMARSAPCERHGRQGRGWARPAEHLQRQLGPQVLRPCVCVVHLLRRRAVCDLPRAALLLESAQPRAHDARVREEAQLQDGHFPDRQRPVPRRGGVFQAVRGCQAGLGGQEKQTAVARAQAQRAAHERARGRPDKAAPARRQGETQGRQKGPCHREP
ncbi:hypothetical protein KL923_000141 [Ogataea haglerorum]|nr:hypothetical protein KL923_000141 [Ogataea haglerorum]